MLFSRPVRVNNNDGDIGATTVTVVPLNIRNASSEKTMLFNPILLLSIFVIIDSQNSTGRIWSHSESSWTK